MDKKKLKIYTRETPVGNGKNATIRFNIKGIITLSLGAQQLLKLSDDDGVLIAQDEDNPVDWYISKVTGNDTAFFARSLGKQTKTKGFNCKALAEKFIGDLAPGKDVVVVKLGRAENGSPWFPMITSALKRKA